MNRTGYSPRRTTSPTTGELVILCSLLVAAIGLAIVTKIA